MVEHTSRRLTWLVLCAGLLLSALATLHFFYPLPYVAKVLAYGYDGYPDDYQWPVAHIAPSARPRPLPRALDSRVANIMQQFDGIEDAEQFLNASDTTALVVLSRGELVDEHYLRGRNAQSLARTYSVSKAAISALIGVAIDDGLLDDAAPVTRYVPELAANDVRFDDIAVRDVLDMRSGIAYSRGIAFPFINADDALLYYHPDVESIILEKMTIAEPPGAFNYNQYNSALLGLILRRVTGRSIAEYLRRTLWEPLGAESPAQWDTDARGFEMMASGLRATPTDLAKLGQLYLRNGQTDQGSLIPPAWTTPSSAAVHASERDSGPRVYRQGWWLVPRPEAPWDFSATGSFGQYLFISPQFDVVIVRTGISRGGWHDDQWLALFAFIAQQL